ncbi:hypothetical protein Gogos_020913 [Gossypium gossypioides]|uniref:Uncharacterized protein n=1 Tax=Gossypium gossypioides TaxID=34282 RepID=A0A7J9D6Z4_GOSGO|nr:hypothetical protein [Gossypium gossypioides]
MIKQGIKWRRTNRVRDEKNASKRHKEEIRQEILSITDEMSKDEGPIFEGEDEPIWKFTPDEYHKWKGNDQTRNTMAKEKCTRAECETRKMLRKDKEEIRQEILSITDEKWKDESPSLKARMSQYGNSPPMVSTWIKSKLLIARFILASSCRMGLSSVVFWTKDKLLGKIFERKEIKVNWEIRPVWDDIVVMGRLFPFTRYCGNDTKALYRTCNEAAKVLSTC